MDDKVCKGKDHAFDPNTEPVCSTQAGWFTFIIDNDDILLFPWTKLHLKGLSISVAFPNQSHLFSGNGLSFGELQLKEIGLYFDKEKHRVKTGRMKLTAVVLF